MKRLDALRAHHSFIFTYVVAAAAKGMSNQVLRGGRLWVDNCNAAEHSALKARSITAVCALGDPDACYAEPMDGIIYLRITLLDHHYVDIKTHFESTTRFIYEQLARPGGRVLVHCAAGVSRSATICMAYLMRYHHLSLPAAYAVLLEARPVVDPNPGFVEQLREWENELPFE